MNTNEQTIHQMGQCISSLVKQATGRESVSSIVHDWVSVEQLARYIYGSGSGDVVTFDTNIPDAIESLIAYITAVQDLNGYDNPWPAGGGKNLTSYDTAYVAPTDITNTVNLFTMNLTEGVTYTFSCKQSENLESSTRNTIAIKPENGTATYENSDVNYNPANLRHVLTYTATVTGTHVFMYWGHTLSASITLSEWQVEVSNSFTSYAPYSNICPISGCTGCTVTNENMLDSSDPDYHADTYAFTFPDEAGTVYGGTLDVLTGVLTVDRQIITVTSCGNVGSAAGSFYILASVDVKKSPGRAISNYLKTYNGVGNTANQPDFSITQSGGTNKTIWGKLNASYTTKELIDAYLLDNPLTICYELNTPVVYQLTAQEVTALIGQNIISANTGNVSVEYKVKEDLV